MQALAAGIELARWNARTSAAVHVVLTDVKKNWFFFALQCVSRQPGSQEAAAAVGVAAAGSRSAGVAGSSGRGAAAGSGSRAAADTSHGLEITVEKDGRRDTFRLFGCRHLRAAVLDDTEPADQSEGFAQVRAFDLRLADQGRRRDPDFPLGLCKPEPRCAIATILWMLNLVCSSMLILASGRECHDAPAYCRHPPTGHVMSTSPSICWPLIPTLLGAGAHFHMHGPEPPQSLFLAGGRDSPLHAAHHEKTNSVTPPTWPWYDIQPCLPTQTHIPNACSPCSPSEPHKASYVLPCRCSVL